ncbi:signal peptidase I [bacterium]|nr:signal peptidase I [bacterium]
MGKVVEMEMSALKRIFFWVVFILFLFLIRTFVVQPFRAFGPSMEPTIPDGKIIFVNRIVYKFRKPERGEIVVFRTSDKPYVYFVKRVIGKEEERVKIVNGDVFINGKELKEEYVVYRSNWNMSEIKVKKNHIFVIGDNRSMDISQHLKVEVSLKNVVGKVIGIK